MPVLNRNEFVAVCSKYLFIYLGLFIYLFSSSTSNGIEVEAKNILAEWPTQG